MRFQGNKNCENYFKKLGHRVQDTENRAVYWKNRSVGWAEVATTAKPNQDPFIRQLIEYAGITPAMTVLDLASGTGDPAITIARILTKGTVTAYDITPEMLAIAVQRSKRNAVNNLTFTVGNMDSLPFPNSTFDAVTSRNGLMFSKNKLVCARETLRVLRPGGKAVWLVWGELNLNPTFLGVSAGLESFFGEIFPPRMIRHNLSKPGQLKEIIRNSGFAKFEELQLTWERRINPDDDYFHRAVSRTAPNRVAALTEADLGVLLEKVRDACAEYLVDDIYKIPIMMRLGIGTAHD